MSARPVITIAWYVVTQGLLSLRWEGQFACKLH